jgi:hypothetical protein
MFGRNEILRLVAHGCFGESFFGMAARLLGFPDHDGFVALREQVGIEGGRFLVVDADQRSREACRFPCLRQHQRDRLSAELDLIVVERTERLAFSRSHVVPVSG